MVKYDYNCGANPGCKEWKNRPRMTCEAVLCEAIASNLPFVQVIQPGHIGTGASPA